jgi:hypothetical protein
MLREGAHEQGRVDQGGGPAPDLLRQGARRGVLALTAHGRGPPALRQELQAQVDELPPPGPQTRQLHRRRRRAHHQASRPAREQVSTCPLPFVLLFSRAVLFLLALEF